MNQQLIIQKGDITKLDIECIVNAANKTLLGGGGVDFAIHKAAGFGLFLECLKLHGCKTGQAKITEGYKLKSNYIIHTVGPVYKGRQKDAELLAECYWNSLEVARVHNIHEIAFPSISTGIYGYPLVEAVPIALMTVKYWMRENTGYDMTIVICCYDDETYGVYSTCAVTTK